MKDKNFVIPLIGWIFTLTFFWVLMYFIKDDKLVNVSVPIIASLFSGVFTLFGVLLTIKKSNTDRKEDEVKKAKPFLDVYDSSECPKNAKIKYLSLDTKNKPKFNKGRRFIMPYLVIDNADNSCSILKGIIVNNEILTSFVDINLFKSTIYYVNINDFIYENDINNLSLLFKDSLDNYYMCKLSFSTKFGNNDIFISNVHSTSMIMMQNESSVEKS